MKHVKNIVIEGKEYPCLLTVSITKALEDANLTIKVYDNPAAMMAEFVKLVWAGCKNYANYQSEPFELSLLDIDIWATDNKEAFAEVIQLWADLNAPAADRSGRDGVRETEKKKS